MGRTLQIRLLGTFSLTYAEQPVAGMLPPRLQSLLAYLVLHRDAPQPRSHLAFLFWPDATEAQARNNLRQALYALRASLPNPGAFLLADTNSLRWRPDAPFTLDVADFELAEAEAKAIRTTDGAQDGARRATLERAINLYHADLLPSCFDEWMTPAREELRQRHLRLLDQLMTLLEDAGDYAAASEWARRMTQHDPLNEEAYRRLMNLLARKGDRTGALRAYHTCSTILQRELGIAPGQETQDAYERLLRVEGAPVQMSRAEHHDIFAITPSLIGRQREWRALLEAWQRAGAGNPGFALVTGEAGIGKSRLAEDLLGWAGQHSATTARARCYAAEGRLSLAPVTDWLRSEELHPHLARLSPVWLSEASRVLPELATEFPTLPRYEPISEVGQRQRFFEALARGVLAAPQPLLLVIDDLQWCDEETLEWLHFLLRFDPAARLLVIGSARMEELSPQHPLHTLLLHLRTTIDVAEVTLQPLDAAETAHLGRLIARRELDEDAALRLFRETEGNPLFVVETMRAGLDALPTRGSDPDTLAATTALPPRVQATIAGRLAQLSPEARELAALAAAIGRAFRLDVLARAANTDEEHAVRALDELWRKRIVRELGASTYDFTHDKLREVAYAEIGAPQRHLLHRRIAQALEAIHADELDAVSAQIASHYERADLAEHAIPFYHRAALVAQQVYAYEDAISLLERAVAMLERLPERLAEGMRRDVQELSLLLALAPTYRIARGWTAPELERVIARVLALCDTVGTDEQRADALYGFGSLLTVQAKLERVQLVDEQMRAAYQRADRTPPPMAGVMLAGARLHLGRIGQASDAFEQMIGADDPKGTLDWLQTQGWNDAVLGRAWQAHALWLLGYPDQALRRGAEAVRLAHDLELPFNQALAATYLALLQQLRADPATARAQAEEAQQLTMQYKVAYYRVWSSILARYAEAWDQPDGERLERLRAAIEEFKATGAQLRLPYYLALVARICRRAQRPAEGLAAIDEALAVVRSTNEHCWDAELHRLRGELLAARGAELEDVEAALQRAREIARSQQARALELRVAMSLARLRIKQSQGQSPVQDARQQLADVYEWFSEGHETPDVRRARALLARLA